MALLSNLANLFTKKASTPLTLPSYRPTNLSSVLTGVQAGGSSLAPVAPKPVATVAPKATTQAPVAPIQPPRPSIAPMPVYQAPSTPQMPTQMPQQSQFGVQGVQVDRFGEALYNTPPLNINPLNANGAISSSNLGATSKADVLSTRNYLEKLQNQILEASIASNAEQTAQQSVNDLTQQELELKNKISQEADRLASSSGLTKEQSANFLTETYRRANVAGTNLALQKSAQSNVLQNEQLARQNQLEAFKTLYGISQPVSVGGNLINPTTGEVIYSAPQAGFELSAGQTRYDAQGNVIASAGANMTDELLSVSEATNLGVPYGTTRSQAYGVSPASTKALSGEASKLLSITETVQPEIQALKDAFLKNYRGSLVGITTGVNRELVKLVDQVADKVGRLRSGGAINTDEATRFKKQIASFMDIPFGSSDSAIRALDGILAEAQSVATSIRGGGMTGTQSGGNIVETKAGPININW